MNSNVLIIFHGLLKNVFKSWNIVGRELTFALYNKGCKVSTISIDGDPGFEIKSIS